MKMKVLALTLLAVLAIGNANAAKLRRGEKRAPLEDPRDAATEEATRAEITEAHKDKKDKEVHKRGILHYGGSLASAGSLWPKTYASLHGYSAHFPAASGFAFSPLPATHLRSPSVLRYNTGIHYKTLDGPSVFSGLSGLSAGAGLNAPLPSYASINSVVPHVHQGGNAQSYIIRPGGALIQSYSVTYPRRKAAVAVKPVHAFASVAPVHHLHPIHPAVADAHPVNAFQNVHPVPAIQPIPLQPAIESVQPIHHLQPVQPVPHLHPVQPIQTVVQVEHFKPSVNYDDTQEFPSFFQTSFIPPAGVPAISPAPVASFNPVQATFPDVPVFPNPPAFPTVPTISPAHIHPSVPDVPAVPDIPTIPSIPNFPQAQVPANGFFPVSVQPPLNQNPPLFANVNPQAQFPAFVPSAGNRPDFGTAEAAPQIPVQPLPSPEPELPSAQPELNQQPWKPILYDPPTAESPVGRPSNTLLPPYGDSPPQGYLPPSPAANSSRYNQEYAIDSGLFENLSEADIQQIFAQASLAAQRDHQHHHHHTAHNYHSHF